jgi:LPXTG-motif cell wall-anchored protein
VVPSHRRADQLAVGGHGRDALFPSGAGERAEVGLPLRILNAGRPLPEGVPHRVEGDAIADAAVQDARDLSSIVEGASADCVRPHLLRVVAASSPRRSRAVRLVVRSSAAKPSSTGGTLPDTGASSPATLAAIAGVLFLLLGGTVLTATRTLIRPRGRH